MERITDMCRGLYKPRPINLCPVCGERIFMTVPILSRLKKNGETTVVCLKCGKRVNATLKNYACYGAEVDLWV